MRFLRQSHEAEMIAEFLQQEYASVDRYRALIEDALQAEGVGPALITEADISNDGENALRRRLFGRYRGYGTGRPSYLTDFPDTGVQWQWVILSPSELLDSRFIRYPFWSGLSGGTRSPRVAADRILNDPTTMEHLEVGIRDRFLSLAQHIRDGQQMPPLILVSARVPPAWCWKGTHGLQGMHLRPTPFLMKSKSYWASRRISPIGTNTSDNPFQAGHAYAQ